MTTVLETIPDALRPDVDRALAWFNAQSDVRFEVTGIVDPDESLAESGERELRLVLCGGDRCEQHRFALRSGGAGGPEVALLDEPQRTAAAGSPIPELDPPPGARREWLDAALARHAFVVLVFYRGFW